MLFDIDINKFKNSFKDYKSYKPYPKCNEREIWDKVNDKVKEKTIEKALQFLNKIKDWRILPITTFMLYANTGDRITYENLYLVRRDALCSLVIAECLENKGRFLDDIVNALISICEESSWCIPAHIYEERTEKFFDLSNQKLDIFASETAQYVALTIYLLEEKLNEISPFIIKSIKNILFEKVLKPMLDLRYEYFWLEENTDATNWSPWICSNLLLVSFTCCDDLDVVNTILERVYKTLEKYYSCIDDDCGNLEGARYWPKSAGTFYLCLQTIKDASNGKINCFNDKKVMRMVENMYDLCLTEDFVFNYGDCPGKVYDYPIYLYMFAKSIGNEKIANFASSKLKDKLILGRHPVLNASIIYLLNYDKFLLSDNFIEVKSDAVYKSTQFFVSYGSGKNAYCLACKGGRFDIPHAHLDVGNFVLFKGKNPIFIDIGIGTYSRETFYDRWSCWIMRSQYHNLPIINNAEEEGDCGKGIVEDYYNNGELVEIGLNLTESYSKDAKLNNFKRKYIIDKVSNTIEITDGLSFKDSNNSAQFNYICALKPNILDGKIIFENKDEIEIVCEKNFSYEIEQINLDDIVLTEIWGEKLYRIKLKFDILPENFSLKLIAK